MSLFQPPTNYFKKFTGAKGEVSPRVWIKKFERVSIALGWNDEMKLNNVGLNLEGAPEKWFKNSYEVEKVVRTKDWTLFKTLFIERFKTRHNLVFLEEKLRTRRQQPQEQALDYFDAITDLINAIQSEDLSNKYSTEEKIKIGVNGLNEFLREKMLIIIWEKQFHGEPPLTIEEFEQTLAGYDEILDNLQFNRGQGQIHIQQISKVEGAKPVTEMIVGRLDQLEAKVNKILKQVEEQDKHSAIWNGRKKTTGDYESRIHHRWASPAHFNRKMDPQRAATSHGGLGTLSCLQFCSSDFVTPRTEFRLKGGGNVTVGWGIVKWHCFGWSHSSFTHSLKPCCTVRGVHKVW